MVVWQHSGFAMQRLNPATQEAMASSKAAHIVNGNACIIGQCIWCLEERHDVSLDGVEAARVVAACG
jgi:hypothetical protein